MKPRSGISIMFMTFIAVSILTLIFVSYYLYLTQHNLSASEAQRIYAEAAQESIDAFYYPPGSEASSLGISQRLMIHNRGIGTVIKYIFVKHGRSLKGPINGGDIVLRSGESYTFNFTDQIVPDGAELLIVTERGSTFTARQGYFNVSLNPTSLKLLLPEETTARTTLVVTSNNYEAKMKITPDMNCRVVGETEFNLIRNGMHTVTIECGPILRPGIYRYPIEVKDIETDYRKKATISIEVREIRPGAEIPFSYVLIIIPEENKSISGRTGQTITINFRVRGYDGYYGTLYFGVLQSPTVIDPISFTPSPVTLTPWDTERIVTFTFKVTGSPRPEPYRIWIRIFEKIPPAEVTRDTDYFDLKIG